MKKNIFDSFKDMIFPTGQYELWGFFTVKNCDVIKELSGKRMAIRQFYLIVIVIQLLIC